MIGINKQKFEQFLYLSRGRGKGGVKTALEHWTSIERWLDNQNLPLTRQSVEYFLVTKKKEGKKDSTLKTYLSLFSLIGDFLKIDLTSDIKLPRGRRERPDILTTDEIKLLIETDLTYGKLYGQPCDRMNAIYKALIEFLYFSGCRREEALGLKVKNVLSDSEVLFVDTKNGEDRAVYIYPRCHRKLLMLCKNQPSDAYVFQNMRGNKIHGQEFLEDLKKRARAAGIKKRVWCHLIRHSTASHLSQQGVDVRVVQKILGHKKLDSTIYYEQFNKDRQVEAIHTLPLIQYYLPVQERVKRIKSTIDSLNLSQDPRIEYLMRETTRYGKSGLVVEVFER